MKRVIVGRNSGGKLFEIFYTSNKDDIVGTVLVKVVAKDIIEALEILMKVDNVNIEDIEGINESRSEVVIA